MGRTRIKKDNHKKQNKKKKNKAKKKPKPKIVTVPQSEGPEVKISQTPTPTSSKSDSESEEGASNISLTSFLKEKNDLREKKLVDENNLEKLAEEKQEPKKCFAEIGVAQWLIDQCELLGLKTPTGIQQQCIPQILDGSDVLGCDKTGSGKTAAFALPILQTWAEEPYGVFALILTPTRELANQIADQFRALGKPAGVRVQVVTGGMDSIRQSQEMAEQPHIIVSTPGRLVDQIDTNCETAETPEIVGGFSLRKIRFLVLDEADRMLESGFPDQLKTIFTVIPKRRQTLLFSATATDALIALGQKSVNKPFTWISDSCVATVDQLSQYYILMPADVKDAYLMHILDKYRDDFPNSSVIIFAQTCKYCQILGLMCNELGFPCVILHSVMKQRDRLATLDQFKSSRVKLLIATDVASRGLDIPSVDLIINHNVPLRPKDYIHRVGRTARAGRTGKSIVLVTQFDVRLVHEIEAHVGSKMAEYSTDEREVLKIATEVAVARRHAEILLDERRFDEQREIHKRKRLLMKGLDPDDPENKRK